MERLEESIGRLLVSLSLLSFSTLPTHPFLFSLFSFSERITHDENKNKQIKSHANDTTQLENEELRRLRAAGTGVNAGGQNQGNRQNCCVVFTDASRDMEEALVMNGISLL